MSAQLEQLAAYAIGETDEVAAAASSAAQSSAESSAPSESGGVGPWDLLLSTEPDLKPAEVAADLGVGPVGAHLYIAARKMLAVLLPDVADVQGTPAIVNLGYAGYFAFFAGEEEPEQADDGEPGTLSDELEAREQTGPDGGPRRTPIHPQQEEA